MWIATPLFLVMETASINLNTCSSIDNHTIFGYTAPMNIHDSGYGTLFRNRTIFRQLIETFVDEPWGFFVGRTD